MTEEIYIGVSGYNNTQLRGLFYPEELPVKNWFEYYCLNFNTFEINGTFYKLPTIKTMQSWYDRSPEGFLFSVKAPKEITHVRKFSDCKKAIDEFYSVCQEGLQEKLGSILFQLPPSFDFSTDKLKLIVNSLNTDFINVVEFRHTSWWRQEVYKFLEEHNITFCSVNYPNLPTTIIGEACNVYVRLHGRPKLFYSNYSHDDLNSLHDQITSIKNVKKVFIYFNNTASAAGLLNALELTTQF